MRRSTIHFLFLILSAVISSSLASGAELIRRNITWTLESGNDPFVQITNESEESKMLTLRILLGDSSYRWRPDYEVPSGENRFVRVRDVLDQLGQKYTEVKNAVTGILQIEFEGADGELTTRTVNLNPKAGVTSEKEQEIERAPVLISVEPQSGNPVGGTVVRIVGDNFNDSTAVKFGGIPAMRSLQSKEVLIAVAPGHAVGMVDIEATNGKKTAKLENGFRYELEGPVILRLDPEKGPARGGVRVAIEGRNFQSGSTVRWDGKNLPARYQSAELLTAVVPPGRSGSVTIEVINPDGKSFVLPEAFQYRGAPQITVVNPGMGGQNGGYTVTINGSNFEPGASALFCGRYGQTTFINSNALAAAVPQGESGYCDITIANPDGESVTFPQGFLYNEPPKIRSALAVPNPIVRLTQATITVEAMDPEIGPLEYDYRVAQGPEGGYVTGHGSEVVFNSPNNTGTVIIQVTVYDEHRAKDQATIEIKVQ